MRIPKGKGFDLTCGIIITVVLDDDFALTGTFLGETNERRIHDNTPPHVEVELEEDPEFILLQLTCPVDERNLPEVPAGTIVAVNVDRILFAFAGGECEDNSSTAIK